MSTIPRGFSAMAVILLAGICPQKSAADSFTGETLLSWSNAEQDSYIQTFVTMASIMATRTHKPSGDCLAAWYLVEPSARESANEAIRGAISRNASYHPSSVIYLVLEGECGPFAPN